MKNILILIFKIYLKKNNKKIKKILNNFPISDFNLLDIGAAGGLNKRWNVIEKKLSVTLVEPNNDNAKKLQIKKNQNIIKKIFYHTKDVKVNFYETKDNYSSGLFKPNLNYLNNFHNSDRFKIVKEKEIITTTLDEEFKNIAKPDFVKIDTEGGELNILKGSLESIDKILGIEIECVFSELRIEQPLFADIKLFLEKYNFVFIDFLHITRWERNRQRSFGIPQISDCLFIKKPTIVISDYKNKKINEDIILKYILILAIYNRSDILEWILDHIEDKLKLKYKLDNLKYLIEQNIRKQNFFERILSFVKNKLNNQ